MATPQTLLNMLQFALIPSRAVGKTGLTGKYDFTLEYSQARLPGAMVRAETAEIQNPTAGDRDRLHG
jgi:uncharacterized protein (TIGR03435 family)